MWKNKIPGAEDFLLDFGLKRGLKVKNKKQNDYQIRSLITSQCAALILRQQLQRQEIQNVFKLFFKSFPLPFL